MLAWSLSGSILVALTVPAGGDGATSPAKAEASLRIVDVGPGEGYRLPAGRRAVAIDPAPRRAVVDHRDRRLDRTLVAIRTPIRDPQGDCVRMLLRDRLARRGAAIDGRLEWRLTGDRSDLGVAGGLKQIFRSVIQRRR